MRRAVLAVLLATPALAETPITPEAFEAHVTGKTITYRQFESVFGIEEYLKAARSAGASRPTNASMAAGILRARTSALSTNTIRPRPAGPSGCGTGPSSPGR
mgnify:CR=1 FL=1